MIYSSSSRALISQARIICQRVKESEEKKVDLWAGELGRMLFDWDLIRGPAYYPDQMIVEESRWWSTVPLIRWLWRERGQIMINCLSLVTGEGALHCHLLLEQGWELRREIYDILLIICVWSDVRQRSVEEGCHPALIGNSRWVPADVKQWSILPTWVFWRVHSSVAYMPIAILRWLKIGVVVRSAILFLWSIQPVCVSVPWMEFELCLPVLLKSRW